MGYKWVYKIKYNVDGSLERDKAHLVATGYTQREAVDYLDTFSPVATLAAIKLLLTIAAMKSYLCLS